jgi:hypothetical protein
MRLNSQRSPSPALWSKCKRVVVFSERDFSLTTTRRFVLRKRKLQNSMPLIPAQTHSGLPTIRRVGLSNRRCLRLIWLISAK